MAKKKDTFEDLDDINLDSFDFDMDSGLDGLDLGGNKRTPIQKIKYSFKKAGKSKATSLDFHLRNLKRILPKEYSGALDLIDKGKRSTDTLYGKTLEKLRPLSNDLKEFARGIAPVSDKVLPRGIREKLKSWANANNDSDSYEDEAGGRESVIGQNLQDIFATNLRETVINASHQRKYQGFKDKVSHIRHSETQDVLRGIYRGISKIAGYNDKINFKWQRKTLELQYRQYFQGEDLLARVSKGNENILKALGAITRNTALPDALKIEMKEMLGYETKQALIRKLQTRTFGSVGAIVDRITSNLGKKIDNVIDTAGFATGMMGMAGGMTDMIDPHQMAAEGILDQLAAMGGGRLNGVVGRNSRVRGFGARLNSNILSAKGYAQHKAKTSPMWKFLNDLLANPTDNLKINESGKSLRDPAVIDNQVKKTWITVIPGLLSRIHREIAVLRTGDTSLGLIKYNFDKDKFLDGSMTKSHVTNSLMSKGGGTYTKDSVKRVLDKVDPDNKLSPSQRAILQRRILDDAMKGNSFYAESYLDRSGYEATDDHKDIAGIMRFMRNHFKAGKKVKIGQNYDIDTKRSQVAELTKDLGLYVNDLIHELDRQLLMGFDEELEEMGFVKVGPYGNEWDKNRIRQFLLEDMGPNVVVPPNEERDRNAQLQANALRIRARARTLFASLITRSRARLNRAGASFQNLRNTDPGRRASVSIRLAQRRMRRGAQQAANSPIGQQVTAAVERARKQARIAARRGRRYYRNLNVLRMGVTRDAIVADLRNIQNDIRNTDSYADAIAKIDIILTALRSSGSAIVASPDLQTVSAELQVLRNSLAPNLINPTDSDSDIARKLAQAREIATQYAAMLNASIRRVTDSIDLRASSRTSANPEDPTVNSTSSTTNRTRSSSATPNSTHTRRTRHYTRDVPEVTNGTMSESINLQTQMLEIQTKILEASITQARLLEGGLRVNGIAIERGGLYSGLRSGTGKLISGIGGLLGGTFKFYGKTLSALGGVAGGTIRGGFNVVKGILGWATGSLRYSDIYVRGNPRHPILLARDLRAGLYRDKTTNKVIRRVKDITGPVIDGEGNEVISMEDFSKGLYDIQGKPVLRNLANKVVGIYGALLSPIVTVAKMGNWILKKSFSLLTRDKDVYVIGETSPRLLARVLQAGGYRSSVTGNPIYSVREIDGDVMDTTGEHVILSVSELTKLVDRHGNPYRTAGEKFRDLVRKGFKYTIGLPIKMAWGLTKGLIKGAYNIVKGGIGFVGKIIKGFGLSSMRSLASAHAYGSLVARNPELLINVHQNEILLSMLELLNQRLPNSRPKRGDADGDGHRDGSWQERFEALRNRHNAVPTERGRRNTRGPNGAPSASGGLLSSLFGGGEGGGGLMSLLKGGNMAMLARLLAGGGLGTIASKLINSGDGEGEGDGFMGSDISGTTLAAGAAGAAALTAPVTTFRALRGTAGLALRGLTSGGGLLARGVMMAAPLLASAATALVSFFGAPIIIGGLALAGIGAGAYYLYNKYGADKSGFLALRMAQYGVVPHEKDRVEKILQLEELLKDHVRINGEAADITINKKTLFKMAEIFGISEANPDALNGWAMWVQERFKPVFIKHSIMAFRYFGKADVTLLEDKLDRNQKVDVLKSLAIPDTGTNYSTQYSPFGTPLTADFGIADMVLSNSVSVAKKEQGGNFIQRWWKSTFGSEKPNETESSSNSLTPIKDMASNNTNPKSAYNSLVQETKKVSTRSRIAYRKLGEQTSTAMRKPFTNTTPTDVPAGIPASPTNMSRAFNTSTKKTFVPDKVSDLRSDGKYFIPVNGRVSSAFGNRVAPKKGASTNHKGIDIAAGAGTPVVAMTSGIVIKREVQNGYGNVVYIQHAGGIVSKYGHLSHFQPEVTVGKKVAGGQTIGYVGMTGTATGNHLHWEIVDSNGRQVDPQAFLNGSPGSSRGVTINNAIIESQAKRFANDDLSVDDPAFEMKADSKPATKIPYATPSTTSAKAFNPNVPKAATKPKEPTRQNQSAPTPSQPALRDPQTRRQVRERTVREQVSAESSLASSRDLSTLVELSRTMVGHLASIDRKISSGGSNPVASAPDVKSPVSLKAKQTLGA